MQPPKMTLTTRHLDSLIIMLLFFNLPVDMLNGIILTKGIMLPMSVSQLFKIVVLICILFRMLFFAGDSFFILTAVYGFLFFSTIVQIVFEGTSNILLDDFIKISRYLAPFIAFFYFKGLFEKPLSKKIKKYLFLWIYFSYGVLAFNILLKLAGLGYPMYAAGNIGTKGYFYAGNEISAILLILCGFIAFQIWNVLNNKLLFFIFLIFNVFLSVLITSKTAMLGIILIFLLIAVNPKEFKLNLKTLFLIGLGGFILLPAVIYFAYKMILSSTIMIRFVYFYEKLDLLTFILSGRNKFVEKMWHFYIEDYTWIQKLIGGGQTFYESKLGTIVEIDLLDIFFAYGIIGALIFCFVVFLLISKAYLLKKNKRRIYARLSYIMILMLTVISMFSGHIYSSGIGGFYIGFIFSLMFYQQENES